MVPSASTVECQETERVVVIAYRARASPEVSAPSMAITTIGSLYDIPEIDLLVLINEKVGDTWDANTAHIASVVGNPDENGQIVSIRVAVETGA